MAPISARNAGFSGNASGDRGHRIRVSNVRPQNHCAAIALFSRISLNDGVCFHGDRECFAQCVSLSKHTALGALPPLPIAPNKHLPAAKRAGAVDFRSRCEGDVIALEYHAPANILDAGRLNEAGMIDCAGA